MFGNSKRTELILILKVGPLGKGQLKISTEKRHLFPVKDRVNLDTKSWPLGKGSTKISTEKRHWFPLKDRVNLDTKVGPLGKGQLKNRQKRDIYFEWLL